MERPQPDSELALAYGMAPQHRVGRRRAKHLLVDLTLSVRVSVALTLLLVLRQMLKHGSIAVRKRYGVHVADCGTQPTFFDQLPHLDVCVASAEKMPALKHVGVAED